MPAAQTAADNFQRHLADNPYPGRGIVLGRGAQDTWVQIYWIMGRSDNSRNRVFVEDGGVVRTAAADPAKLEDPSLVIYTAMQRVDEQFVVTNGAQTDAIHTTLSEGRAFVDALLPWAHEPDAPNFTPRISGCTDRAHERIWLSVIRASTCDGRSSEHQFYHYADVPAGFGYCVTTYQGDGNPLPPFAGSPLLVPLSGDSDAIAGAYWDALDDENRVSLAVRTIDVDGSATVRITNKLSQV